MDCAIDNDWFVVLWNTTKEEIASCMTSCLGGTEIGGIRVYIEDHVGSTVSDFCIRVCSHVVKELVDTSKCLFSRGTLLCGDC
jgi:hypothetical protein